MIFRLLLIAIFFSSCSEEIKRYKKPESLLTEVQMVDALTELMKVEAVVRIKDYRVDQFAESLAKTGDSILISMNIQPDQFESSLAYYGSYQDKIDAIYADVLEKLNADLGEIESE